MSFELDFVRIRWKQKPDFTGAAFPFGCVYERGISRPVIRGMVEGRVRALPLAYEILCADCLTPEVLGKPKGEQPHAPGCLRAPKKEPSVHERDTVPGGAALPREMAPPDLLEDMEQAYLPGAAETLAPAVQQALDALPEDVQPVPLPEPAQVPREFKYPTREGLGTAERPYRQQRRGR